jgi:homopolymeric O-antigen transport system permease protein
MAFAMSAAALTLRFFQRELKNRFAGSFSGGLWALIQPLIQLAVYAFVFVNIFKARVPGAGAPGYVPYLVVALWPWTAFSEAILRSTTAIQDNAALIGKVAMPREVLVLSTVASSFAVHMAGFIAIVLVLGIARDDIFLASLPLALLLFVPLFALALGISLIAASVQVFVRDLVQALGQILNVLMFVAPIFYDRSILPANMQGWMSVHPFTFYAEAFRAVLLHHGVLSLTHCAIAIAIAAAVLLLGQWVFKRLDSHFEDFL